MNIFQNKKRFFLIALLIVFIYTILGVLNFSKYGGPCNAGLLIIFLIPPFLLCSIFLLISIFRFFRNKKHSAIALCSISFIIWTTIIIVMNIDDSNNMIEFLFYFSIYSLFNLWVLFFQIKNLKSNYQDANY